MKQHWKIGEIAALTGLTVRTLRFYDQISLYSPTGRTDSGHRWYNEADIARLQQILSLKEMGLSLDEVKAFLAGKLYSPIEVIALQMERLQENIRIQQKLLKELEAVSSLMQNKASLTVEDFTILLGMMKKSQEKYIAERRTSWETNLNRLGDYLGETTKLGE